MVDGVHHWDENGLRDPRREPHEIQKIHWEIVEFFQLLAQGFQKKKGIDGAGECGVEISSSDIMQVLAKLNK